MQEELGKEDAHQYNIKQGVGGLVDIEFLAQYLQLRHGKAHPRVRVPGTVNALRALEREGILSPDESRKLREYYAFLRKLESRLRVVANQSKSFLARDPDKLQTLAKRMGYGGSGAGASLLGDYEEFRQVIRGMFEDKVARSSA